MLALIISFILSMYGGPNVYSDGAFQKAINDGVIPYETQIPWSTEHYLLYTQPGVSPSAEDDDVYTQPGVSPSVQPAQENEPVEEEICATCTGDVGTLTINGILSVGLQSGWDQSIVDGPCAAYFWMSDSCVYIADHNNQAFSNLFSVYVGCTADVAGRGVTCVCTDYGYVDDRGMICMSDGSIAGENYGSCVVMYTCTSNGRFITIWQ